MKKIFLILAIILIFLFIILYFFNPIFILGDNKYKVSYAGKAYNSTGGLGYNYEYLEINLNRKIIDFRCDYEYHTAEGKTTSSGNRILKKRYHISNEIAKEIQDAINNKSTNDLNNIESNYYYNIYTKNGTKYIDESFKNILYSIDKDLYLSIP